MLTHDEQAIHDLIANWQDAAAAGDLTQLLNLIAEDVVFLQPGQPPMRGKDAFAENYRAAIQTFRIESSAEIQELQIVANWAFCWTQLTVTTTPLQAGTPMRRSGYTLTILRKQADGVWVIARDANMLTPDPPAST
jgi:uncharacterized protein (TIGR02246 family)